MSQEKLEAFVEVKPKLPSMRERVLRTLGASLYGATKADICKATGIKGSTVTGRLDELMDEGLVYTDTFSDGTHYIRTNPENVHYFAKKRKVEKMQILIKRVQKFFPNLDPSVITDMNKEVSDVIKGML